MLSWMLPCLLMTHNCNCVDFYENGASDRYVECLNHVVTNYIENLESYNNIRFTNKTGKMDENGIQHIGLQFDSGKYVDLTGARQMMLGLIESFLQAINDFPGKKPYLNCDPLTSCHLEIRVRFTSDCKFPYPAPGQVKYMIFRNGKITYYQGNPRCIGQLERIRDESLCSARHIVKRPLTEVCGGQYLPPK
jgi:hypothetical protein